MHKLFSPRHAASATIALKNRNWNPKAVQQLVHELAEHGSLAELPDPTMRFLSDLVPTLNTPLPRHLVFSELGSILEHQQISALLATKDFELAASRIGQSIDPELQLLLHDNGEQVYLAKLTAGKWASAFEYAVKTEKYQLVRYLWNHKTHLHTVPVSSAVFEQFIELIGRLRDRTMLKALTHSSFDAPLTSRTVVACLNCMEVDEIVEVVQQPWIAQVVDVQDARFASDMLAQNLDKVLDICTTTFTANLLLQGVYRQNTSQTVLHLYRMLRPQFTPDSTTAQILANSAYRLGNSKLLMYAIWDELKEVATERKFYETWLACQLVGTNYNSALFVLAEMARRHIPLRQNVQLMLYRKFDKLGNTQPLLDVMSLGFGKQYTTFDENAAALESPNVQQARDNAKCFVNGFKPELEPRAALTQMLKFDERKRINEQR